MVNLGALEQANNRVIMAVCSEHCAFKQSGCSNSDHHGLRKLVLQNDHLGLTYDIWNIWNLLFFLAEVYPEAS